MTTDLQLERFLKETDCGLAQRIRVVAADELAGPLEPGHGRICNTDVRGGGGIHWVLFYITGGKDERGKNISIVNYFDPLGECKTSYPNFEKFIKKHDKMVSNEGYQVQHSDPSISFSNTCGANCALVAHLFCDHPETFQTLADVMEVFDVSKTTEGTEFNECQTLVYLSTRFKKFSRIFSKLKGCN